MSEDIREIAPEEERASSLKEVRIELPRRTLLLTLDDVTHIQQSLHAFLIASDRRDSGWYEDREYLINSSRGAGYIDQDGVSIGAWRLDASTEPLRLRIWSPGFEDAQVRMGYVAELAFGNAWQVTAVRRSRAWRR